MNEESLENQKNQKIKKPKPKKKDNSKIQVDTSKNETKKDDDKNLIVDTSKVSKPKPKPKSKPKPKKDNKEKVDTLKNEKKDNKEKVDTSSDVSQIVSGIVSDLDSVKEQQRKEKLKQKNKARKEKKKEAKKEAKKKEEEQKKIPTVQKGKKKYGAFSKLSYNTEEIIEEEIKKKPNVSDLTQGHSGLTEKLISTLVDESYECMICCSSVKKNSATWNCECCSAIFHLYCIKKWYKENQTSEAGILVCPQCRNETRGMPNKYTCFCGQTKDPEGSDYLTPHSCGNVCGKERKETKCPHKCTLLCHPGVCFRKGTLVFMSDGSVRKIENVKVGDFVLGPDSTPREVVRTTSGTEIMYRITQKTNHVKEKLGGIEFDCTPQHLLCLFTSVNPNQYNSSMGKRNFTAVEYNKLNHNFKIMENNETIDMVYRHKEIFYHDEEGKEEAIKKGHDFFMQIDTKPIEWMGQAQHIDHYLVGKARSSTCQKFAPILIERDDFRKTCETFKINENNVEKVAWLLGVWIGDRYSTRSIISVNIDDKDEIERIQEYTESLGLNASMEPYQTPIQKKSNSKGGIIKIYSDVESKKLGVDNCFWNIIKYYGMGTSGSKMIPDIFKTQEISIREWLLAGIIDSDGYVNKEKKMMVEVSTIYKNMCDELILLGRSLGIKVSATVRHEHVDKMGIKHKKSYNVYFSPCLSLFNVLSKCSIERKRVEKPEEVNYDDQLFHFTIEKLRENNAEPLKKKQKIINFEKKNICELTDTQIQIIMKENRNFNESLRKMEEKSIELGCKISNSALSEYLNGNTSSKNARVFCLEIIQSNFHLILNDSNALQVLIDEKDEYFGFSLSKNTDELFLLANNAIVHNCPECPANRKINCFCGKNNFIIRCSEKIDSKSCGKICGKKLNCGKHFCQSVCHEGDCETCQIKFEQTCYCGKEKGEKYCSNSIIQKVNGEDRTFSCAKVCGKTLSCGNHKCELPCHPGSCHECYFSVSNITTCSCGKTKLEKERKSCLDPIPTCGKDCKKKLPCGKHKCLKKCHTGECGHCMEMVELLCRCGSSSSKIPCCLTYLEPSDPFALEIKEKYQISFPIICNKICNTTKNCVRHKCKIQCCPSKNPNTFDVQGNHICHLTCGRKLNCEKHKCDLPCHGLSCPPCVNVIRQRISCKCGKTHLEPPQHCGTKLPPCPFECSIKRECGHEPKHNCHQKGECPPCVELTDKMCSGGHTEVQVPCCTTQISCGRSCDKALGCGLHNCSRICHFGTCIGSDSMAKEKGCGQKCGKSLPCQHLCIEPCHPLQSECNQNCNQKVKISCECRHLTEVVDCESARALVASRYPDIKYSALAYPPLIDCNSECRLLARNKKLAEAFNIDLVKHDLPAYSRFLISYSKRNPSFLEEIENIFADFLKDSTTARYAFSPMSSDKRSFIWELSVFYHFEYSSVDKKPYKSSVIVKNQKSKIPAIRLSIILQDSSKMKILEEKLETLEIQEEKRKEHQPNTYYKKPSKEVTDDDEWNENTMQTVEDISFGPKPTKKLSKESVKSKNIWDNLVDE
eukprot:gene8764-712_t